MKPKVWWKRDLYGMPPIVIFYELCGLCVNFNLYHATEYFNSNNSLTEGAFLSIILGNSTLRWDGCTHFYWCSNTDNSCQGLDELSEIEKLPVLKDYSKEHGDNYWHSCTGGRDLVTIMQVVEEFGKEIFSEKFPGWPD